MKIKHLFIALLGIVLTSSFLPASAADTLSGPVTLEDIVSGKYRSKGAGEMISMNDHSSYAVAQGENILRYDLKSGKVIDTLFCGSKARENQIESIDGFCFNAQESRILIWNNKKPVYRRSFLADYYVYDCRHNILDKLSENGAMRDASFSPNGRMVAFVRDNNIFIKKLDFKSEVAVTNDGEFNAIINGAADWLYEEEFCTTRMYEWTANSDYLVYARFDERKVREYGFDLYYCSQPPYKDYQYYPGQLRFKYPYAGEQNSKISLRAYHVVNRSTQKLKIETDTTDYIPYLYRMGQSNMMAVAVLNRNQNQFKLYSINVKSNINHLLLNENAENYIDPDNLMAIEFSSKDFTYLSEKSGYRQLYLYNTNGTLKKQLTSGKQDLTAYYGRDTLNQYFYYQSIDGKPYRKAIYRCDAKGRQSKISTGEGTHRADFSSDFRYFVDSYSNVSTPTVHTLRQADGKSVRIIEDNSALKEKLASIPHAEKEFFETPAADGTTLYGWMIKPRDFDANRQYPLLLVQYSGPDSQNALDEYDFDWEYFLAQEGYIVASVDGRGTGARGRDFRQQTYMHLGIMETEDQTEVARALGTRPYIDASRIGIWGWCYGGYVTLLALTQTTPIFKAGIAIAPVTDYRYYNTAYTERFMRRPQENPDGYDQGSALLRADRLQGNLLLVHGLADDNVHPNQSMEFIDALVRSGKQFEMQLYPNRNHSILGTTYRSHLYNRWWIFLQNNL